MGNVSGKFATGYLYEGLFPILYVPFKNRIAGYLYVPHFISIGSRQITNSFPIDSLQITHVFHIHVGSYKLPT